MSRGTRLALAIVASLGTAALLPATAGAFGPGHLRAVDLARGTAPLTPQIRMSTSALNYARIRCHGVQVGDPRKQPPMLVCR
jgi:hypothetical protein